MPTVSLVSGGYQQQTTKVIVTSAAQAQQFVQKQQVGVNSSSPLPKMPTPNFLGVKPITKAISGGSSEDVSTMASPNYANSLSSFTSSSPQLSGPLPSLFTSNVASTQGGSPAAAAVFTHVASPQSQVAVFSTSPTSTALGQSSPMANLLQRSPLTPAGVSSSYHGGSASSSPAMAQHVTLPRSTTTVGHQQQMLSMVQSSPAGLSIVQQQQQHHHHHHQSPGVVMQQAQLQQQFQPHLQQQQQQQQELQQQLQLQRQPGGLGGSQQFYLP